jgi:hypothetical protein
MTGQNGSFTGRTSASEAAERLTGFVADLAELRREAGQPSLRKMAGVSHYSHTALSSVLSGTRLPSQELTLAFVRACGGDEQAWRERWRREYELLHGPPAQTVVAGGPGTASAPDRRRPALTVGVAALVVVLVLAVAAAAGAFRSGPPAGPGASPPVAAPVAAPDGSDPQEQRCQLDAVSARTVPIPDPDPSRPAYGSLTLRYSPHCQAAWPLFVSSERVPTGATIRLRASRPSDGAASEFDYPYMVPPQVFSVFGNVLQTGRGCVSVTVEIVAPQSGGPLANAATPCLQPS